MALLTKMGDVLDGKLESKNNRARSSRLKMNWKCQWIRKMQ